MAGVNHESLNRKLRRGSQSVYPAKKKKPTGFPAKYQGKCCLCHKAIKVGDSIRLFAAGKAYHVECI